MLAHHDVDLKFNAAARAIPPWPGSPHDPPGESLEAPAPWSPGEARAKMKLPPGLFSSADSSAEAGNEVLREDAIDMPMSFFASEAMVWPSGNADSLGDTFMDADSFPNPWLWPTDAPIGGANLRESFGRLEADRNPTTLPMKVPFHPGDQQSRTAWNTEEILSTEASVTSQQQQDAAAQDRFRACRWHKSAETVGIISSNGQFFTKTAGPRRSRVSDRGARVDLASICMVFDSSLRCGGFHRYNYQIMEGFLGPADGAGFVFDSKVRRNNIQRMRSVFLNQRGRICLRNGTQVTKLQVQLPPLMVGVTLTLCIDLDGLMARFEVSDGGAMCGCADVSLQGLFDMGLGAAQLRSGFFCAVVTGSITVGIS